MTQRTWQLLGPDGLYDSASPGSLGGQSGGGIYGRLDCAAAARAIANGGYVEHRVFFADAADAVACGYRPCGTCLPEDHRAWRERTVIESQVGASPEVAAAAAVEWLLELNATVVSIGHGRSERARSIATAFEQRWAGLGRPTPDEPFPRGVGAVVDWPRRAASWLRPARRLADGTADHWFVADSFDGLVPVARRLRSDTEWDPSRTVAVVIGAPNTTRAPPGAAVLAGLRTLTLDGHRGTVNAPRVERSHADTEPLRSGFTPQPNVGAEAAETRSVTVGELFRRGGSNP